MTRLEAIRDIRCGRGILCSFVGVEDVHDRPHTFQVCISGQTAYLTCNAMRKTYRVRLNARQVLSFIRLHYPRKGEGPISLRKAA